jgi:hypothetical protein
MKHLALGIFIYLLSCLGAYKFFQTAYSEGGRWSILAPRTRDVVVVFIPVMNTGFAIMHLFGANVREVNAPVDRSTFFNLPPKKP